ncbi:SNF2 family N-terminal domain-containing protein [Cytidiella melzeri]|nr:SNF2 family N-terminal domain-containing protein [Cytidiella melzeri]
MSTSQSESCCAASSPIVPGNDYQAGPYNLTHFLPVGTLVLHSSNSSVSMISCSRHWHAHSGHQLSALLAPENIKLAGQIDFLLSHKFIVATCRSAANVSSSTEYTTTLLIRIYLIPFDLANVEGALRRRDETILSPARRYLRSLLLQVTRDYNVWKGKISATFPPTATQSFISSDTDGQSLAELYNTLASPVVVVPKNHIPAGLGSLTLNILQQSIEGLRSKLHGYQRRSVARMVQQELNPSACPDPLYVPMQGLDSRVFYFQPASMEILQTRPMVSQSRGGILCEELGTGKTVMILALILATIDQLPTPEESVLDPRPILTPLAFRHFPSEPFADARRRLAAGSSSGRRRGSEAPRRMPSLVEILLHYARVNPTVVGRSSNFPTSGLWNAYQRNTPFYHHYEEEPLEVLRTSRNKSAQGPRVMFITSATLVIVPPNLLNQWEGEINKHCDETPKCFIVGENAKLPEARDLANLYDIILMTHSRFAREAGEKKVEGLGSWTTCNCAVPAGSSVRVPACKCKGIDGVSPLLQIRWKRLVIDEGHVAATTTTNLMMLVKSLSVERRWIVTGTPTTNLMGLSFGERSKPNPTDTSEAISQALERKLRYLADHDSERGDDSDDELRDILNGFSLEYPEDDVQPKQRQWSRTSREDLTKLGNMLSHFLQVPQFAANSSLFASHVIAPLMDPSGPLAGSVRVLRQVMESVMVRHRVEDVEREVTLPPLQQETVLLDLDPYAVITYNIMQSAIVTNVVDSERVGSDYLLHPNNAKELHQLIENISQAMFWHVDETVFLVDERVGESQRYRESSSRKLAEGKITHNDFEMLHRALEFTSAAASNTVWRALNMHPNVFNRVYNMPIPIYQAWSHLPSNVGQIHNSQSGEPYHLMIPERLKTLRNYVIKKPLSSVARIIEYGEVVADEDRRRHQIHMSTPRVKKAMKEHDPMDRDVRRTNAKADSTSSFAGRGDSVKKLIETEAKRKALEADDQNGHVLMRNDLCRSSPLAGVEIRNSTSSKLNYILNEIQLYSSTSKFLVFSKSPLTLMYIAEALGVLGVHYKLTSRGAKVLHQDVTTFETSETYRVFLMELKHGARGLNLVTASRIIFCEPVWQADVETQAIKRVHRIGQVSPVSVKTLAIRSTAEEFMVQRREDLKRGRGASNGKLPNLADDISMRDFIAHPTFLPDPGPPSVQLRYPLLSSSSSPCGSSPAGASTPSRSSPSDSTHSVSPASPSNSAVRTIRIPGLKRKAPTETHSLGSLYIAVQKRPYIHPESTVKSRYDSDDRQEGPSSSSNSETRTYSVGADADEMMQPQLKRPRVAVRFSSS